MSGRISDSISPPCGYARTDTSLFIWFENKMHIQSFIHPGGVSKVPVRGFFIPATPARWSHRVQSAAALLPPSSCTPPQLTPNPRGRYHNIFTRVPTNAATAPHEWVNCFFISGTTHTISVQRWWAAVALHCLSLRGNVPLNKRT